MPGGAVGAMAVFMAVMFLLGFFLDTFEIIFIILPIFGPPLILLGYDPLWLALLSPSTSRPASSPPPSAPPSPPPPPPPPPRPPPPPPAGVGAPPTLLQPVAPLLVWLFPPCDLAAPPPHAAWGPLAPRRAPPAGAGSGPARGPGAPAPTPRQSAHPRPRRRTGRWPLAPASAASSTATSAPARSTPCARRCTTPPGRRPPRAEVLGVISLLLWALIFIVTVKYVLFLMRADNRGEGGTLSLMALAQRALGRAHAVPVFVLGVPAPPCSTATPDHARDLGAVRGRGPEARHAGVRPLRRADHGRDPVALFAVQRHGTGKVAALFGPITAAWFVVMAVLGLLHLGDDPGVFAALSPHHASASSATTAWSGSSCSARVFLAVTGAEALYADMGHFGRGPIQAAWIGLVFPALALNYLGQGALVLAGTPRRSPTRSSCWRRAGRCCRWCCSRPSPR